LIANLRTVLGTQGCLAVATITSTQGCQFGFFEVRWTQGCQFGFFEVRFKFLAFFNAQNLSVFQSKAWHNIVWVQLHLLQISSDEPMTMQGAKNIAKILLLL